MIFPNVTLGVSSKGNTRALTLCLAGVLNAAVVPQFIQIRLEGEFYGFDDFYLAQLSDLALMRGSQISIHSFKSIGVRPSRDWQLDNCRTEYLWMLDDDVVPSSRCLLAYQEILEIASRHPTTTFFAGSKADVNNRRNYPHFRTTKVGRGEFIATPNGSHNHSLEYDVDSCFRLFAPAKVLDTGNCLFYLPPIRKANCRFVLFEDNANPSGDATTFSLVLNKAGLTGVFVPAAAAYHLEKPGGGFNEFEARRAMLLRICDVLGCDKEIVHKLFMPAITPV